MDSIFVLQHIGAGMYGSSNLPEILSLAGPLSAVHPMGDEIIEHGKL